MSLIPRLLWVFPLKRHFRFTLVGFFFSLLCLLKDLACFEKQWSSFFSSMDQESHLSILELSEAQAGEVGPTLQLISTFSQP